MRALDSAAAAHPRAERKLLVLDRDAVLAVRAPSIDVVPAYEWLLATPKRP